MLMPAIRAIDYPCRCLWRGFEQITKTAPWRRMILHFSHMGLTEGRTFMVPFEKGRIHPRAGTNHAAGATFQISKGFRPARRSGLAARGEVVGPAAGGRQGVADLGAEDLTIGPREARAPLARGGRDRGFLQLVATVADRAPVGPHGAQPVLGAGGPRGLQPHGT